MGHLDICCLDYGFKPSCSDLHMVDYERNTDYQCVKEKDEKQKRQGTEWLLTIQITETKT